MIFLLCLFASCSCPYTYYESIHIRIEYRWTPKWLTYDILQHIGQCQLVLMFCGLLANLCTTFFLLSIEINGMRYWLKQMSGGKEEKKLIRIRCYLWQTHKSIKIKRNYRKEIETNEEWRMYMKNASNGIETIGNGIWKKLKQKNSQVMLL